MADEVPRHRCETCGFLALRNRITGLLDEAPQEYRWRAEIPKFRNPSVRGVQPMSTSFYDYPYSGVPICLVRAHPLHNEFASQNQAKEEEIFATLERKRDCAERGLFTPWQQGFTPKEHREMMDREKMLKWQAEREAADRTYRLQQSKENAKARKEEVALVRGGVWIAVGAVVIGTIATIVGAFIEAGIIP